jgi:hypothetical protein
MSKLAAIEQETTIRKTRRLPAPGEVLVKLGDTVKENTPIARGRVRNPEIIEVRVDQKLGVDPHNLRSYMLKKEGDAVKKDEIIALRRSFFGSTKVCRSPLDGTLEAFSESSGKTLIRGYPLSIEVKAHVPGKVTELFPFEGAAVECKGSIIRGAIGFGGEIHGSIEVLVDTPDEVLDARSPDEGGLNRRRSGHSWWCRREGPHGVSGLRVRLWRHGARKYGVHTHRDGGFRH